jgi:hypothetical protein
MPDTAIPKDLPERVAMLERLFDRMDRRLERMEDRLNAVADRVAALPTTWQLITYVLGAQVTFAGLLFAAYKLGH